MQIVFGTRCQEDLAETVAQRIAAGVDREFACSVIAVVRRWAFDFTFVLACVRKATR